MRSGRRSLIAGLALLPFIPARGAADEGSPQALELPFADMRRLSPTVWIGKLADRLWLTCFTFRMPKTGWFPANGMIVAGDDGATVIDPGWSPEQGQLLLKAAAELGRGRIARGVVTHYHADRIAGIAAFAAAGIPVYANPLTVGLATAYAEPVPQPVKGLEKAAQQMGPVELYHPGAGHTLDNITVWHQPSRTLFGGRLIKSTTSTDLGNMADGDRTAYAPTLARLAARYPQRRWTIPGHGSIAGNALGWTQRMAAA